MSIKGNEEEFGKYLTTILTISRKILRLLFDLELEKNKELNVMIENIKKEPEQHLFFFENMIDFKSLIKLLNIYSKKNKLIVLIDTENNNEVHEHQKIFQKLLQEIIELRNDLWHNSVNYKNPKKYYHAILNIKKAYDMFKNNKLINKKELLENCINYLDISLEFFEKYN